MYYVFIDNTTIYPDPRIPDRVENLVLNESYETSQEAYEKIASLMVEMNIIVMTRFPILHKDIRMNRDLTWEVVHLDGCRSIGRAYAQEVIEVAD